MIKIILLVSLFILNCGKQVKESPTSYSIFNQGTLYGYKNSKGKVVIKPEYMTAKPFINQVGYVADRQKWMAIDSKGKILFIPLAVGEDNMPDPFQDGLARFVKDGKIGFYDSTGKIVIPAQFTYAKPFKNGQAHVCNDCKKEVKKNQEEYVGKYFYIDKTGRETGGN
jgi:hypothetical protein